MLSVLRMVLTFGVLGMTCAPAEAQEPSEFAKTYFGAISRDKQIVRNYAYTNMTPAQVMALLTLSQNVDVSCDGIRADRNFHEQMAGKVRRGVFQSKAKRRQQVKQTIRAFQTRYGIAHFEKDREKFCRAARKEITDGTFLGASLVLE